MSGPPPAVARARVAVKAALATRIEQLADSTPPGAYAPSIVVGVSGGADSLALAATVQWVGSRMGLETVACIVDHGLQNESGQVAERAKTQCERLGITEVVIERVTVKNGTGGIEQAARAARYAALEDVAERTGSLAIALGHTLDDHAEQVLLGLSRGAGARSLAGIPRSRGHIIRPFLGTGRDETTGLWRQDTIAICEALDIAVWNDPMNSDPNFLRVAVRMQALPALREHLGEHIATNLVRTADLLADDAEYLDATAREEGAALRREAAGPALIALDVYGLSARPRAIRTRIIKAAAAEAERMHGDSSRKSLVRRQILQVDALVSAYRGQGSVPLPGKIEAERADGLLIFSPGEPRRTSHDTPPERTAT